MKTINLELSKRLTPYLENVDTEYYYKSNGKIGKNIFNNNYIKNIKGVKTLVSEEAIDFMYNLDLGYKKEIFIIINDKNIFGKFLIQAGSEKKYLEMKGKTLLGAIEKMLEYLLDNNLLGKQ